MDNLDSWAMNMTQVFIRNTGAIDTFSRDATYSERSAMDIALRSEYVASRLNGPVGVATSRPLR